MIQSVGFWVMVGIWLYLTLNQLVDFLVFIFADYPGWPLLTPLKAQMQKCSKCSREFCSSINYRRHLRVHHRLKRLDKVSFISLHRHACSFISPAAVTFFGRFGTCKSGVHHGQMFSSVNVDFAYRIVLFIATLIVNLHAINCSERCFVFPCRILPKIGTC